MRGVDGQGHEGRRRGDRRHDAHRTHGKSAVQSGQPDDTRDAGRCSRQKLGNSRKGVSGDDHPERDTREADRLREDEDGQDADSPRRKPPEEVAGSPGKRGAKRQQRRHAALRVADRARGRLGVELIRVIQHGRLGRTSRLAIVVAGNRVQELGLHLEVEALCPVLDQPQPEMDVSEEATLLGLRKRGTWAKLARAADVVQERSGEQQVRA